MTVALFLVPAALLKMSKRFESVMNVRDFLTLEVNP